MLFVRQRSAFPAAHTEGGDGAPRALGMGVLGAKLQPPGCSQGTLCQENSPFSCPEQVGDRRGGPGDWGWRPG